MPAEPPGDYTVVMEPALGAKLRPHQVEGARFIFSALLGRLGNASALGRGCILADDMGLGKTLQTIAVIHTMLTQGPHGGRPEALNAIVVSPTTLCLNWKGEFEKWLGGASVIKTQVVTSDLGKDTISMRLKSFLNASRRTVLIISYETAKIHAEQLQLCPFGLMVCDEAHRLKNPKTGLYKALLPFQTRMRIMVTGTPIQNDLDEFYALMNFAIPGCLGDPKAFDKEIGRPIIRSRDLEATDAELRAGRRASAALTGKLDLMMLRRTNEVIAKYLPAKLDVNVFCMLSEHQQQMYATQCSKGLQAYDGTAKSAFQTVTMLKKIVNDPEAAMHAHELQRMEQQRMEQQRMEQQRASQACAAGATEGGGGGPSAAAKPLALPPREPIDAAASLQRSGKLQVLLSLLREVRSRSDDRFVLISNFTTTLSLFEAVLSSHQLPYKRLDGSMPPPKRQECIDTFNADPTYFAFLLSSKAGGCGVTLTGANRLVLFDPDWNPAVDNQALARVWRSGQRKACYVYRFFATGSLEEVCYERQCSKEGLAGEIVDGDGGDSLRFSEAELKSLFNPKFDTLSLFHERSKCRCCHAQACHAHAPTATASSASASASAPSASSASSALVPSDQRGYTHLLPGSSALAEADPCLARAASVSPISLCYCRVTDLTCDESVEAGVARGFPDYSASG